MQSEKFDSSLSRALPIVLLVATFLFFIGLIALAFGATNSTATTGTLTPAITSQEFLVSVAVSAVAGIGYAAMGYYQGHLQKGEKFDPRAFAVTVLLGGFLGIFVSISAPTDLTGLIGVGFTSFTTFGAIYFVQKAIGIYTALKNPSK